METMPLVRVVTSSMFEENAYLLSLAETGDCIVVDPGLEPDRIVAELNAAGLRPVAILNTHGHSDHIAGNAMMKEEWPDAPLIIGAGDAWKLTDPVGNLSAGFGLELISPEADQTVSEGDVVEFAGIRWTVLETPGHSGGHVVFVAKELSPMIVLGGDVLFAGSIGRSDFPDGDHETLLDSIRTKLFPLPESAVVLPGHGPPTTIGRERRTNPYLR
jgi:glyoxylase-like metal-dependent hydrolase (beta-lactamase superfamily II)